MPMPETKTTKKNRAPAEWSAGALVEVLKRHNAEPAIVEGKLVLKHAERLPVAERDEIRASLEEHKELLRLHVEMEARKRARPRSLSFAHTSFGHGVGGHVVEEARDEDGRVVSLCVWSRRV